MGIWRAGTSFRALFRERECRTLVRPAVDEDSLLHLASLAPDQLRPEFVSQMASIREDLLSRVGPKQLYVGQDMDGPMLGALVESYSAAINEGGVPNIKKSYAYVVEEKLRHAFDGAIKSLKDGLQMLSMDGDRGLLPSTLEFAVAAHALHRDAVSQFYNAAGAMGSSVEAPSWRDKLDHEYGKAFEHAYRQLESSSKVICGDLLQPLMQSVLEDPINQGCFDSPEGGAAAAAAMGQVLTQELLVRFRKQGHGPAVASTLASVLINRLPALYTNLARRADATSSQVTNPRLAAAHVNASHLCFLQPGCAGCRASS